MSFRTFRTLSAIILLSLVLVAPALAGRMLNTIDPVATINPGGHNVLVTGPIGCDADEIVTIEVLVTQSSTGTTATGSFHARCTGEVRDWQIHAATRGATTFAEGEARVEATAMTKGRGQVTDSWSWWRPVTLVTR